MFVIAIYDECFEGHLRIRGGCLVNGPLEFALHALNALGILNIQFSVYVKQYMLDGTYFSNIAYFLNRYSGQKICM